jgi:phosphomannomutase
MNDPDTAARLELTTVRELARDWIAGDPDPVTRQELQRLVDEGDVAQLSERFSGVLDFGTAGLRGVVGAGPMRMNRAVVIATTRGLADHLLATESDARSRPVVVGFDARQDSERFARETVGVLLAAGLRVSWFPEPTPTPVVAFAGRELGATASIVITASHNPPEYNGYKVYASNGAQIVPPTDERIAAAIAAVGPASEVPRVTSFSQADVEELGTFARRRYQDAIAAARPRIDVARDLAIAYTPLHGVGGRYVTEAFSRAGYGRLYVVEDQFAPDGAFPTVRFPNPEEPGALDLAVATAERTGAGLILANDPDADRLAAVVPVDGGWRPLTGNQIGILLADHLLANDEGRGGQPIVLSSIVSSPMLASVAAAYDARYEPTLTGFKWICNAALALERSEGVRFVFGYEEALGYTIGTVVRDKDGISAAVAFADLVASLAAEGATVIDRLSALSRRHGLWVSHQKSIVAPGSDGLVRIDAAMRRIGTTVPDELAGHTVTAATDYRQGAERRPRWLPATPLVELDLDQGSRVLMRPSGTEPKLKIYVDLRDELVETGMFEPEEQRLLEDATAIADDLARFVGLA